MDQQVLQEFDRWFKENPNEERRFVFPLGPKSVVFDVGAYDGAWARGIFDRYHCQLFAFEPSPLFFTKTCDKLQGTGGTVFPLALGATTKEMTLNESGDASSSHRKGEGSTEVQVKQVDIERFIREMGIAQIDLLKVNIEGGEYELLERLIETDLAKRCRFMLIQFHPWVENHYARKRSIAENLQRTHKNVFNYEYVWELWELMS